VSNLSTEAGRIDDEEYARRFKARILQRLSGPGTEWTEEQAREAAAAEWDAIDPAEQRIGYENDPEGCADEALSYWEND
jgi:hypothetical protein